MSRTGTEEETRRFVIEESAGKSRLDKALAALAPDLSRTRLSALVKQGAVTLDGAVCVDPAHKVGAGQVIAIAVPPPVEGTPRPENIPLEILFEDSDVIVLNKQAGLVVHPGAGNGRGTLVNALLYHCGGALSGIGGVIRPGIVHRLDKDTSGLMIVAKNDAAHQALSAQLAERTLSRTYHALVLGVPMPLKGTIEGAIGRHPKNRLKMAVTARGRPAKTHYKVLKNSHNLFSLVECKLESGRTHQIRVHMAKIGHPLLGDPLYGPAPTALSKALKNMDLSEEERDFIRAFPRQALHAYQIEFLHPADGKPRRFTVQPPEDMRKLLVILNKIYNASP